MKKKQQRLTGLLMIVAAVILFLCQQVGLLPKAEPMMQAETAVTQAAPDPTPAPDSPITAPQAIADYLFAHGELPENFITKKEAQALGWDSDINNLSDVAPGKSIGGDRFGNYEGVLPREKGRTYYECDCDYVSGSRGAKRIVYADDGHVYYTEDHYVTFVELFPSEEM